MNKRTIGALQVLLGATCFSFAGVFTKWLPWSSWTLIGMRSITCALLLALARRSFKVHITKGVLLGAIGMAVTGILFITATKLTTAANAIVLQYAMPVFVIALCWIFLGQKPSRTDLITTVCVMAGVVLCSWEGFTGGGGKLAGDLLAIGSAVSYSLVFFCSRLPNTNAMDYTYLGSLMTLPFCIFAGVDPNMSANPVHWLAVCAMGLCLGGGYFFISKSLNNVHPFTSAVIANLEPVLNPLWVFIFLGEDPGIFTIVGMVVVIVTVTIYSLKGAKRS
ncbi:MAG: EamA family transporter [Clostridia bacterium]|nr:EamA family transporter [Clostridia bacterium]